MQGRRVGGNTFEFHSWDRRSEIAGLGREMNE
jgi:hypothetical protein